MLAPAASPPEPPAVLLLQQYQIIVFKILGQKEIMMGATQRVQDWCWVEMDQGQGVAVEPVG